MDVLALAKINALKKSGAIGYEETACTEILSETTVDVALVEDAGLSIAFMPTFIPTLNPLQVLLFCFDGKTYECKFIEECIGWGNASILGFGDDTGEPFFLTLETENDEVVQTILIAEEGTHTLSVMDKRDVVHQIDKKFIASPAMEEIDVYGEFGCVLLPIQGNLHISLGSIYDVVRNILWRVREVYDNGNLPLLIFNKGHETENEYAVTPLSFDKYGKNLSFIVFAVGEGIRATKLFELEGSGMLYVSDV